VRFKSHIPIVNSVRINSLNNTTSLNNGSHNTSLNNGSIGNTTPRVDKDKQEETTLCSNSASLLWRERSVGRPRGIHINNSSLKSELLADLPPQ